jgi:hypothetical protein
LQSIAGAAGGQSIKVATTELVGAYQRIADVLLNQYRVTFQSAARGDARVQVDVAADGFAGSSALTVALPGDADAPGGAARGETATERGGGRAVVEPVTAALSIVIALIVGAVLVSLGRAGLRSARDRALEVPSDGNREHDDVVAV